MRIAFVILALSIFPPIRVLTQNSPIPVIKTPQAPSSLFQMPNHFPQPNQNHNGFPLNPSYQQQIQEHERIEAMWKHEQEKNRQAALELENKNGSTIRFKFDSHLNEEGANFYKIAFDTLNNMLTGKSQLSYKKAVFASEWAFFEGRLNFKEFDATIKYSADLIRAKLKEEKLPNTSLAKNWMTFRFFSDTLKVKLVSPEKRTVTHYPIRYDFEDFYGEKDWTKGMVFKLMKQQTGQCHSMPLFYLILTEELGSTAYLANAPEHTYIKIPYINSTYQSIELTNGHLTNDAYVVSSGFIKSEAVASKIYMKPLTKKQTVAQCLLDLAKGYGNKYGHDEFYLTMLNTALTYQPSNATGTYMQASYYYWLYQHVLKQDPYIAQRPREQYPQLQEIIENFKQYDEKLKKMGYQEMPKEAYAEWLQSVEKEKSKQMKQAIHESIWQTKK
jgi:hypothetical protein